jgi:hypothetical protein
MAQCRSCLEASFGSGAREFGDGSLSGTMIAADFNGDGNPDVAVFGYNPTFYFIDRVILLMGDGKGGFSSPVSYAISPLTNPQSMVAADFDSDGNVDLVIGGDGGQVALFRGTGTGTLRPLQILTLSKGATYLAAGDFNGDGRMDLVSIGNDVTIYFGDGLGGFPTSLSLPSIGTRHTPAVGDVNQDGISDLVFSQGGNSGLVEVVLGTAVGPFAPPRVYPAGNDSQGVALARLTGAAYPDIVVRTRDGVEVLLNSGTGTFLAPVHYATPGDSIYDAGLVFIGDFDGDGKSDVLVTNFGAHYFFLGNGAGGLVGPQEFDTATGVALVADFDHDGLSDLAFGELFVRHNGGGPSTMFPASLNTGDSTATILLGDFNEDGRPDVVALGREGHIILSTASGFAPPASLRTGFTDLATVADFNRDGHLDIVLTAGVETVTLLGDGFGGFTEILNQPSSPNPSAVASGDFNGDLKPDLLITDTATASLYLFPGIGDGTFSSPSVFAVGLNPRGLVVDDFNGDGKLDVAVTTDSGVSILLGNGAGGFSSILLVPTSKPIGPIVSGDFDKDGKKDLALLVQTAYATCFVQVLWGTGDGGMTPATPFASGSFPGGLAVGDFNQDGFPDLVVAGGSPGSGTAFWMNDGARGWRRSSSFEISGNDGGAIAGTVAVGDFNKDGLPDVAASFQNDLFVLYNTNCESRHVVEEVEESSCNVVGTVFGVQPQIGVYDDGGNRVVCDVGTVTASLVSGPAGAVLGGTRSVGAVSGLAVFTDLMVDRAGTGYQMEFAHAVAGKARSLRFTAGLGVSVDGPGQLCVGTGAVFSAGAGYETYVWQVDGGVVASAGSTLSVGGFSAGHHTVMVTVKKDRCSVSASKGVDVDAGPSATVSAPGAVCPFSSGNTASVPDAGVGATYAWTISNGVITSGAGTLSITFKAGPAGSTVLTVTVTNSTGCAATGSRSVTIDRTLGCAAPVGFFTVAPCRLVDTRNPVGALGGPALQASQARNFVMVGTCGIPPNATALSINVAAVQSTSGPGFFTVYPGAGSARPLAATINYSAGQIRANNAIVPLGAGGDLAVYCGQGAGTAHLVIDVNGYFQ